MRNSSQTDPLLLSVDQAAQRLSIGRSLMYTLVMRGAIASVKVGRRRLVARDAILAFIRRLEAEQAEEVDG